MADYSGVTPGTEWQDQASVHLIVHPIEYSLGRDHTNPGVERKQGTKGNDSIKRDSASLLGSEVLRLSDQEVSEPRGDSTEHSDVIYRKQVELSHQWVIFIIIKISQVQWEPEGRKVEGYGLFPGSTYNLWVRMKLCRRHGKRNGTTS